MNLSSLNIEYTVDILKSLNKSWQFLSNLRASCYRLPNSDLILNILSTNIVNIEKNIGLEEIDKIYDSDLDANIFAIKTIWNEPFSVELIEKCVQIVLQEHTFVIDLEDKQILEDNCFTILKSDNDPIIKVFLLHIVLSNTFKYIQKKNNILRIFDVYFIHYQGGLDHPILYHPSHFNVFSDIDEYISSENIFDENIIIQLINQFQTICLLGTEVLNIYNRHIDETYKKIKENRYLDKIFKTEETFLKIFGKTVIDLKYLMSTFDWKRDKTIRFLSSLCNANLFIKFKSDRKTIFINNTITRTFLEVKESSLIQDIIINNGNQKKL